MTRPGSYIAFQQLILDDLTKYSVKTKGIKPSSKIGSISIKCHLIRATLKLEKKKVEGSQSSWQIKKITSSEKTICSFHMGS